MPTYDYEAFSETGERSRGQAQAMSEVELAIQLKAQGQLLVSATPSSGRPAQSTWWRLQRDLSPADCAAVAKELAVLTGSGVTISEALSLAAGRKRGNSVTAALLSEVGGRVSEGMPVSEALASVATNVPPILVSLVSAGESRGDLAGSLDEAARYLERNAKLQDKIRSALIYPLILLIVALSALVVILLFLVPSLLPLFDGTNVQPPVILVCAKTLTDVLSDQWRLVVLLMISLAIAGLVIRHQNWWQHLCSQSLLIMPLLGPLVKQHNTALFSRTLGTLLQSGVDLSSALTSAINVLPSRSMASRIDNMIEQIRGGAPLTTAMEQTKQFDAVHINFVAIGERSGRVAEMLVQFANFTDDAIEESSERLMGLLAPLLTIGVGLLVGGLILSVLQAILSVNDLALG